MIKRSFLLCSIIHIWYVYVSFVRPSSSFFFLVLSELQHDDDDMVANAIERSPLFSGSQHKSLGPLFLPPKVVSATFRKLLLCDCRHGRSSRVAATICQVMWTSGGREFAASLAIVNVAKKSSLSSYYFEVNSDDSKPPRNHYWTLKM